MEMKERLSEKMEHFYLKSGFEMMESINRVEDAGKHVVKFHIGEPDFKTPENIIKAAIKAMEDGMTHYNPTMGIPKLRKLIAQMLTKRYGKKVPWERVFVMPGAKPVLFYTIVSLMNPGDEVIFPSPAFPVYKAVVEMLGGVVKPWVLKPENNFQPDLDDLKKLITPKTKLLIINSPHNPTGVVFKREVIEGLSEIVREHDLVLMSDEIYSQLIYEGEHFSPYQIDGMEDKLVLLDGFSKTYAMTGWRLGYGVFPEWMIEKVRTLATCNHSCTTTFVQYGGIEALEGDQSSILKMKETFEKRRNHFLKGLSDIEGIKVIVPHGAFYLFIDVSSFGMSSEEVSNYLLNNYGVSTLPGANFGAGGEGFLRFSYATSLEEIDEGLKRMKEAFSELGEKKAKKMG